MFNVIGTDKKYPVGYGSNLTYDVTYDTDPVPTPQPTDPRVFRVHELKICALMFCLLVINIYNSVLILPV